MEDTQEQSNNSRPWLYKKGQSGNPGGRPKGTISLKEYARQKLAAMTDEEREEFFNGIPKDLIWKMSEGNPQTSVDAKVDGNININRVTFDNYNDPAQPETGQNQG